MNLGYACINMTLDDISPRRRTTLAYLKKLDQQAKFDKLNSLLNNNLTATLKILKFNQRHKIKLYRLTSDLVPFATHKIIKDWDYLKIAKDKLKLIGNYIKANNHRVSIHLGQYTVLNSNKDKVVANAIADLRYHNQILEAMNLDNQAKIILHIGGVYGDKKAAIKRFKNNFARLEQKIKDRLIIENDDTSYQSNEVLAIAKDLGIPMVFDVHHFNCNHSQDEQIKDLLPEIFSTWDSKPKIHFSSPASEKKYKSHDPYIDSQDFDEFIKLAYDLELKDFDVMLECKEKDKAVFKLRKESEFF